MEEKRKRGCLITGYLVLYALGSMLMSVNFLTNGALKDTRPEYMVSETTAILISIVGVLGLVSVIGTFLWNKIAIIALPVISLINSIISISSKSTDDSSASLIVAELMALAISSFVSYMLLKKKKSEAEQELID